MVKAKEHSIALEMRKDKVSLGKIAKTLGISKGTASLWCKDIQFTQEQQKLIRLNSQLPETRLRNLELAREALRATHIEKIEKIKKLPKEKLQKTQEQKKKQNRDISNRHSIKRRMEIKKKCVDYKGGSCVKCGYNKCQSSMVFHHRNPSEKEFTISRSMLASINWDAIYKELDKCDLMCMNCHGELHDEMVKEKYKKLGLWVPV